MSDKIKIGIVGLGMVGEPFRRWFEDHREYKRGEDLFCYDTDPKKTYIDDVNQADFIFVCVPTPSEPDGSCNTDLVELVVNKIADGKAIIIKSTVIPGTTESLQQKNPYKKLLFSPEFLTEAQAWEDFLKPNRQILGSTERSFTEMTEIMLLLPPSSFSRPWGSDYLKKFMNATEAELLKYASNVFGYIKVIFANIIADVAQGLNQKFELEDTNVEVSHKNVLEALGADFRVNPAWLNVDHGDYCGAGGYCFPKDMNAFIAFIDQLIKLLEPHHDVELLRKGNAFLKAAVGYNRAVLHKQGLTEPEVSKHNHELIINKRKPIRVKK